MRDAGLAAGVGFLFLALAMLASFINNQRLVRSVGDHLAVYHRLSGTPPTPKLQAQQRLRADSRLLDDWLRRGEPLRYRLGLYQGGRLIPSLKPLSMTGRRPRRRVRSSSRLCRGRRRSASIAWRCSIPANRR